MCGVDRGWNVEFFFRSGFGYYVFCFVVDGGFSCCFCDVDEYYGEWISCSLVKYGFWQLCCDDGVCL